MDEDMDREEHFKNRAGICFAFAFGIVVAFWVVVVGILLVSYSIWYVINTFG